LLRRANAPKRDLVAPIWGADVSVAKETNENVLKE
jgi:hypothetical protein